MNRQDWIKLQAESHNFYATPVGVAFRKFTSAHAVLWQADGDDRMSDAKAKKLAEAEQQAASAFLVEIDKLFDLILRLSPPVVDAEVVASLPAHKLIGRLSA